jgi:hypothetical protein
MKKVAAAVVAVLLLAVGVLAWRVSALSADVERLSSAPGLLASAPSEPAAPSTPSAPATLAPRPATSAPADSSVGARLAAVESRLDALATKFADASRVNDDLQSVIAEVVAERMKQNETYAVASSRNIISASAQFQQTAKCDANSNGTGEYGGFLEMSGGAAGRMQAPLNPPVLSSAFRTLTAAGEVTRNGYLYRVFLPDARGVGVGEPQNGFDRTAVDPRLAETTWCVYAWPVAYGKTGTKTFFTNQGGDVLATDAATYSGSGAGPASDAAFTDRGAITGRVAIGTKGSDGNTWTQVN